MTNVKKSLTRLTSWRTEVLEICCALNDVMPTAFNIIKEAARRFENEETVVTATDFDRELAANPVKDFVTIDGR